MTKTFKIIWQVIEMSAVAGNLHGFAAYDAHQRRSVEKFMKQDQNKYENKI